LSIRNWREKGGLLTRKEACLSALGVCRKIDSKDYKASAARVLAILSQVGKFYELIQLLKADSVLILEN
jgi:hypothetical protein